MKLPMAVGMNPGGIVKVTRDTRPNQLACADPLITLFQESTKMRTIPAKWLSLFAATFALLFLASPQRAAAQDDDPPARAARLSYAQGAVSFEPAGTDDWVDAVVN